jgi:hypothetical protein
MKTKEKERKKDQRKRDEIKRGKGKIKQDFLQFIAVWSYQTKSDLEIHQKYAEYTAGKFFFMLANFA